MHKLLYITNRIDGPGGLERVLSIKTNSLIELYHYDVHIITLNQETKTPLFYDFNSKIKLHNISVNGNKFRYLKAYRDGINKTIKNIKPDIVIVCDDGLKGLCLPIIIGKKQPIFFETCLS